MHCCPFYYLLSDCAFGVALATASLDPTIETMIECTIANDASVFENIQSSSSVQCTIGDQLFKTPTAPSRLISTSTTLSNLSKPKIDGASAFAIDPTTTTATKIPSIVGHEHDETLGKYCFHDGIRIALVLTCTLKSHRYLRIVNLCENCEISDRIRKSCAGCFIFLLEFSFWSINFDIFIYQTVASSRLKIKMRMHFF